MTAISLPQPKTKGSEMILATANTICSRLPPGIDADQFKAAVLMEANGLKDDTDKVSVARTAMHAAIVGLVPGKPLNHCYFVPYKQQCQLIIGYEGFLELAFRNNFLRTVYADVVLGDEPFQHRVTRSGPHVLHEPALDREFKYEQVKAAYCVWENSNGGHSVVVVSRTELNKVNTGRNVWASDPIAMCKKTAIRRAAKMWRKSSALSHAIQLDEQAERGEDQASVEVMPSPRLSLDQLSDEPEEPKPAKKGGQPELVGAGSKREPMNSDEFKGPEDDEIPY